MAYSLKRKESLEKAVRRLGRERVEHALKCLKEADRPDAIHCARKDIKRTRAVLRLVRAGIEKSDFKRLKKTLREAASHLAGPRDAYISMQTLRHLKGHFKGRLAPEALRHTQAELRKAFEREMKRFQTEKIANAAGQILHRFAKMCGRLKIRGNGWKALGPGVKAAYGRGRRAFLLASKDSSSENFHAWRRRVKDLGYHVRLLQPIRPSQMGAMAGELEKLADTLGDDHDLAVLQQDLARRSDGNPRRPELDALHGLMEERQQELRAAALSLGTRFYAEKPSTFCVRLAKHWQAWRGRLAA